MGKTTITVKEAYETDAWEVGTLTFLTSNAKIVSVIDRGNKTWFTLWTEDDWFLAEAEDKLLLTTVEPSVSGDVSEPATDAAAAENAELKRRLEWRESSLDFVNKQAEDAAEQLDALRAAIEDATNVLKNIQKDLGLSTSESNQMHEHCQYLIDHLTWSLEGNTNAFRL